MWAIASCVNNTLSKQQRCYFLNFCASLFTQGGGGGGGHDADEVVVPVVKIQGASRIFIAFF